MKRRPNFLIILIDDLRFDEFGAGGHPYMRTPQVDRIAREGAIFERAFHTTPICSPICRSSERSPRGRSFCSRISTMARSTSF